MARELNAANIRDQIDNGFFPKAFGEQLIELDCNAGIAQQVYSMVQGGWGIMQAMIKAYSDADRKARPLAAGMPRPKQSLTDENNVRGAETLQQSHRRRMPASKPQDQRLAQMRKAQAAMRGEMGIGVAGPIVR